MDLETQLETYLDELAANPEHLDSLTRLSQVFRDDLSGLVRVLASRAEESDGVLAARLLLEAGVLCMMVIGDTERAGVFLDRATSQSAGTVVEPEARLFMLAYMDKVEELFAFFGEQVETLGSEAAQGRLYYQMGRLLEHMFEDLGEAENAYTWAAELSQRPYPARWGLQRVYLKRAEHERYAELVYEEVQATEDPYRQLESLMLLGDAYRDFLEQSEAAAQCYASVFEVDPTHAGARSALEALGYELPAAEPEAEGFQLESEAEMDEPAAEIPASGDGFDLESESVLDADSEREDEFELEPDALTDDESEPVAEPSEEPEEILADGETSEPGADDELQSDDFDAVEDSDDVENSDVEDSDVEDSDDVDLETESQIELSEAAPDDDVSEVSDASHEEESEAQQRDGEGEQRQARASSSDWQARFLEKVQSAGQEDEPLEVLVGAARLGVRHGLSDEFSLRLWREALALDVVERFWEAAHFHFESASFWTEIIEEIDSADLKGRIGLVNLGDVELAKEHGADEWVEDYEAGQSNWRKFQRSLEDRWADRDKDETARLSYTRMADIARSYGDQDKEMDALRRLDRQLKDDMTVKARLKEIYGATEKWPMYVDILKSELDGAPDDPVEQIDILEAMVRVYRDEMSHDMMVVNTYKEILEIAPGNLDALDALVELYDKLNRSSELINTLQTKAEIVEEKDEQVALWSQIAELFLERFRNQSEAMKAYEQVLEIEPYHSGAIEFLKEMYKKRREWEGLIEIHKREISTFDTDADKAAGLKEVAQLATEKLRKPELAAQLWLEVREVAPDDPEALEALEGLYERTKDFEALAEILETKVKRSESEEERMKLLSKLAPIYSDRLDDVDSAIRTWRSALEIDSEDLKSQKALERLFIDNRRWDDLQSFYAESESWSELVRLFETLANTMKEDGTKIELLVRAASIWREQLEDTSRAERDLDRVLQIDPRNEFAALQLEPIYQEAEKWADLVEVCEIVLSYQEEASERRPYQLKLAHLHEERLENLNDAFTWYSRAYVENPSEDDIVAELERTAGEVGAWEGLVEVYETALNEASADDAVTRKNQLRLGRVLSEELGRFDEALERFGSVLDDNPDDQVALKSTAEIYEKTERWDDLMAIYQRQIELTSEDSERVAILSGMALIAEHQAQDIDGAIEQYKEALEIDPEYEPGLKELHRLYAQEGHHEELAAVIRREIALVEKRALQRHERGVSVVAVESLLPGEDGGESLEVEEELESDVPLDSPEVEEEFGGVQDSATEAESLEELDDEPASEVEASEPSESFEEVVEGLAEETGTSEAQALALYLTDEEIDRLVELKYQLGALCQSVLAEDEEAVDCLTAIVRWRPNHEDACAALEAYLDDQQFRADVAVALEPVYEVHGDWQNLVDVLEIQIEAVENASTVELLERIARIQLDELGLPADSFATWGRLLHVEAAHEEARNELYRIADALDQWPELVERLEAVRDELETGELRREYNFLIGEVYADRLEEPSRAQRAFESILEDEPESRRALAELEELFTAIEAWEDLRGVLERELELATQTDEIEQLRLRVALLHDEMLDQPSAAIEVYETILKDNHSSLRAVSALNRLYASEAQWEQLAQNLEHELELSDADQKGDVKNRLAAVLEEHLEEPGGAVDLYSSVLEDEPENSRALAALERLMHQESAPQYRISRIVEDHYAGSSDWESLVAALDVRASTAEDTSEGIETLHRIASLYEERGRDRNAAFDTYARAFSHDVENPTSLEALYRLAGELRANERLVEVFEREASEQSAPDIQRDMLRRAASTYRDEGNLKSANARLHEVLEIFPDDLETIIELENIYRQTQEWGELVGILKLKADLVDDGDERIELLHQAGQIYQEILEEPFDAIDIFSRVLELDPENAVAIDKLQFLYAEEEQWADLLRVYGRKVELETDDEARKDLYYAMGAIHREALEQPLDAIEVFKKVLEIAPDEVAAWVQLDELYEQTEQWQELLETLEAELALATVAEESQNLRFRMGRVWEEYLYEPGKAIELYRSVLEEAPQHESTTNALEALIEQGEHEVQAAEVLEPIYRELGQWGKLINVYHLLIEASADPDRKIELHEKVGEVYELRLMDAESAFMAHVGALSVSPGRSATLDTLERLSAQLDAWHRLVSELEARIEDTSDFEAVRTLHVRVARIQEQELDDAQAAIECFNRVLELEPADEEAIESLDRLYQREGQWENLAEILRTRIMNAQAPEEALEHRLRLGQVYQTALEDAQEALSVYQNILLDDPENPDAIASLEQMFMSGQAVQQVAGILEPFYSSRGQHEKLVEIYVQRLEMVSEPHERFDIWKLVGQTFLNELNDAESALASFGRALAEQPDDEETIQFIEELAEDTGNWEPAAQLLIEALDSPQIDEESSMKIYLSLAQIFDRKLGRIDQAENAYLNVLELDEGEPRALEALDRIYETQLRWDDLAQIISQRIQGVYDEDAVVELNFRLAEIYYTQLEAPERAVDTYRTILDIQPAHLESLKMLETIFYQQQRWDELFGVLENESEVVDDPEERAEIYAQMAQIAEEMLGRGAEAVDLWNRVLSIRTTDLQAMRNLRRLYRSEERWQDLVSILEREVELVSDPEDELGLYEELGVLLDEKLGNEGQALDAWNRVLELQPMHLEALESLYQLHTRAAAHEDRASVLERLLNHDAVDSERKFGFWQELGRLYGQDLMDPDRAIDAWKHVVSLDPSNEEAITALEQLFVQEARWEEAAQVLELKLDIVPDQFDRIDLLLRIGNIWEERILDRDRAAQYYELVLELDPLNEPAGMALEAIYRDQDTVESYQALATLFLDRADHHADDPERFLDALRQSSHIYEHHLQQLEGAFLVLVTAFRPETSDDTSLLQDLERLASETGQWADLVERCEEVLQQMEDGPEAVDLHQKVGKWLAEDLGQPDDAVYHLRRALMIESDNIEVISSLEGLYREINAWPELAQILKDRVALTMDPDEQVEIWRRLGELYEMQMGQVDEAIEAYRCILDIDPSDILAIECLERIYQAYDRWQSLVEILRRKVEATYDPEQIVNIRYRIAQIYEERLDDIDQAIDSYTQVLEVDQAYSPALAELARLYMSTQNWEQLLSVYEQQLQLTHEPAEQVSIYGRMATLHEDQFEDIDRAIESYNNILMTAPDNLMAVRELERLYGATENWFDQAEVYQRHADIVVAEPDQQAQVLTELGILQRDQIGDPNAAIDAFNRSLQVDSSQPEVWGWLASLYEETANWESAIDALRQLSSLSQGTEDRVEILHRIGFMYEANLQDDSSAEQVYGQALELDPSHEATLLALRDLYRRRGDWQSVIRTLKSAEEVTRDLGKKGEFLAEVGQVYQAELDDSVSAQHYYESALENDPENLDAAEPLINMYINEQRWERAAPLLEKVLSGGEEREPEHMHRRFVQMARVSMELGQEEQALQAFREAYEMDSTDTPTLLGLSELLYRRQEWEQAFNIFQALQFNHTDALDTDQIVDVYYKSGMIKERVGERRKAIQMFQKALEYAPQHQPSLSALVDNYEAENNWGEVVNALGFLVDAEGDPTVRFAHLARIGDIWLEELGDPGSATRAYLEALDIEPDSVVILRKLLTIYNKTSQWNEAVEILKRLIEQEDQPSKKGKYFYTIGVLYREQIHDPMAAVEAFDEALDADVKQLKAFEAIDRILTQQKEWKELERAYRRMLRRVTEYDATEQGGRDADMEGIKILLWQNLGEIYRSRLNLMKSAIQAYEMAVGLKPKDPSLRLILAELYERSEDGLDGAVEQHKELIKLDPFRIESYRALWKTYMKKKHYDKAWCMAGALSFLQNANDQEEKFYRQYLGQNLKKSKGQFNQEMYKRLYHPDQDMIISMIMSILGQGLRGYYASSIKDWGLHKRKDVLSPDEQLMFCKIYTHMARTEAIMPAPTLYQKLDQALGMRNVNTEPPSFVIGGDMMQGKSDRDLAFTIAKQLCLVRPEHYLASTPFPTEVLKIFFMAAMHVTDPSLGVGQTLGDQGATVIKEIQRLPGPMLLQLQKFMKSYLKKGENPNLSEWLKMVDHTSTRMGLLLCGDLHQAASNIKNDMNPIGKASVKDRIREMVLFSISDEYFELRQQLGLSIESR